MATPKQIEANRRNAQKSTGPKTEEGKDRVRLNGLKHGCTAETIVLPGEDAAHYHATLDRWMGDGRTGSICEAALLERAARMEWRLHRIELAQTSRLTL